MKAGAFLRKELAELARDRRVLLLSVVFPVLINPLMFAVSSRMEKRATEKLEARVVAVAITASDSTAQARAERAIEVAHADSTIRVVSRGTAQELREKVRTGSVECWLNFAPDSAGIPRATLVSHGPRAASAEAASRLKGVLADTEEEEKERLWNAAGGEGKFSDQFRIQTTDVALESESKGAEAGRQIPLLLVLTLFIAGSALAADVVAGEKERGTLETLYLTPARRSDVAFAKYIVVVGATFLAGLLNIASMALATHQGWMNPGGAAGALPAEGLVTALLLIVPLSALIGGVLLGLSAYARSIKEYQVLVMPLMLVAILPGLLAMNQDIPLNPWTALIPIANVTLAVRDGLLGPIPFPLFVIVSLASVGWGLIVMRWVGQVLSREEAILGFDPEPLLAKTSTGRYRAVMLGMCLTCLGFFYFGQLLQAWNLRVGLFLSLWGILPACAAATLHIGWNGGRLHEILSFRRPDLRALLGAILLGAGSYVPMLDGIFRLQSLFLPMPEGAMKPLEDLTQGSPALLFFLVALSPGVMEELTFRGAFLGLLRRVVADRRAVILSSIFFGIIHLSVFRFIPTALLGLVLGFLVVRTGSILPSMAFHMIYNGSAVFADRLLGEEGLKANPLAWAISLLLLVGGTLLVRQSKPATS